MKSKDDIPVDLLRQILDYDPQTGALVWRKRPIHMFKAGKQTQEHNAAMWNGANAGNVAFTAPTANHYRQGTIFGKRYLAHRVVWAIYHGEWPAEDVDHENGIRHDNRIANLRSVSRSGNMRNACKSKRNKSGVVGVNWASREKKWCAAIGDNNGGKHLGYFKSFDDAVNARKNAQHRLEYHQTHGRENPYVL